MKHAPLFALLTFMLLLAPSCQDDDGGQMGVPLNSFDVNGNNHETFLAHVILDDGPVYSDAFGIAIVNGYMREDTINGISLTTDATQGVVLWVDNGGPAVNNESAVSISVATHTLGDETTAFTDLFQFTDTYQWGTDTYGDADTDTATTYEIGNTGSGTLTINSISIDYAARAGQLDLAYVFDDGTTTVTGQYIGRFELLNGF